MVEDRNKSIPNIIQDAVNYEAKINLKHCTSSSDKLFEPVTEESMKGAIAKISGIKCVEDRFMPEDMIVLVSGSVPVAMARFTEMANEIKRLESIIYDLKMEVAKLRGE